MFHFIFDYNYGSLWQMSIIFLPQETKMNTLPNMYKLFYFNLTMSPLYVVKLKMTQKQPTAYAVHSVELIVPDFWWELCRVTRLMTENWVLNNQQRG